VRPTTARRVCALGSAAVVALALLVVPAGTAAAGPGSSGSLAAQVKQLNADIDRVGDELAEMAVAYEAASEELARLTQLQFAQGTDSQELQEAADESRAALGEMARAAYKGGVPPVVTAIMSGDPRMLSDLAYVRRSVNRLSVTRSELARDLDEQSAGADRAREQTQVLRAAALEQRQSLERLLLELTAKTDVLTAELTAAAARLAEARAAEQRAAEQRAAQARDAAARRAAAAATALAAARGSVPGIAGGGGGAGCLAASPIGEANGFLSDAGLCPLGFVPGHRLRTDAALAMNALNAARVAATGTSICVTDSYRSYPEQVDVFRRKPSLAATPGRSQHGWGMAVDLCGGIQAFGSEPHAWMQVNAPRFGWVHPAWARQDGSRPEAWHWEFQG
jgi:D-alanyl-D-alanine carboxypeptidase